METWKYIVEKVTCRKYVALRDYDGKINVRLSYNIGDIILANRLGRTIAELKPNGETSVSWVKSWHYVNPIPIWKKWFN